jgi:hypothetical protein
VTDPQTHPQSNPTTQPQTTAFMPSELDYRVEHPVDPRAIIAEQLAQSNQVLRECWRAQRDGENSMQVQLDVLKMAARLMKITMKQAQMLEGRPREFLYRVVVERGGRAGWQDDSTGIATAPEFRGDGGPPAKILKTIHGAGPRVHTP